MNETIRHQLPLLAAGQAQKEVTHNEALLAIDRQLHLAVAGRRRTEPPAGAAAGASFIVAASPTGVWAGHAGDIASFDGFGWSFTAPVPGCLAWIVDEAIFTVFDGAWSDAGWPVAGLRIGGRTVLGAAPAVVTAPSGGGIIDAEARAAIAAVITALRVQGVIV